MEEGRLGQRGQRLVKAVDDHIRPLLQGALREIGMKSEVGSVGLVHDQGDPPPVDLPGNGPDVRDHTVVGGGDQDHRLYPGMFIKRSFHCAYRDFCIQLDVRPETGVQVHRLQPVQIDGMIHRFVTVPAHQHLVAPPGAAEDGAQYPRRAAVHEKSRLTGPVDAGCLLLGLPQDPIRVVEVVKALDLRDVYPVGQVTAEALRVPLVPRHVKPVIVGNAVSVQPVIKFSHLIASYSFVSCLIIS